MKKLFNKNGLILLLASVSLSWVVNAGDIFYVYKDKKGNTHIEDSIPGELVKYGYKIVNDKGMVLKEVLSVVDKEKKAKARRLRTAEQKAKEAQKKRNRNLLRRFTSLEEIRETGNKKIMALQSQIDVTNQHIEAFEKNLNDLEQQASNLRENQKTVPSKNLQAIERMKDNIQKNKDYVVQRKKEQHKTRDEFIMLIDEYKKLLAKREG